MRMRLSDIVPGVKLRTAVRGRRLSSLFPPRGGQTLVEYLLMLAVVASMATMTAVFFHKPVLGGLFTLVGSIVGSGTAK